MPSAKAEKNCIAIVDGEVDYACHLMEYMLRETGSLYDIRIYTSAEQLCGDGEQGRIALLIIAETLLSELTVSINTFPAVLVLSEEGKTASGGVTRDIPVISKYQSGETIMAFIRMKGLLKYVNVTGIVRPGRSMEWIAVYSPVTDCLKTTFAITLGQVLSDKDRALYMNFEAFSGLKYLKQGTGGDVPAPENGTAQYSSFEVQDMGSAADLIYFNECAREKVVKELSSIVISAGGLDIVPPMRSFRELSKVSYRQWIDLFETIGSGTEYSYLILDVSEAVNGMFELLRSCSRVYTMNRQDALSEARIREYEDLLANEGFEDIYAKTVHLELPYFADVAEDIGIDPAKFRHSGLADHIRDLLAGEER